MTMTKASDLAKSIKVNASRVAHINRHLPTGEPSGNAHQRRIEKRKRIRSGHEALYGVTPQNYLQWIGKK